VENDKEHPRVLIEEWFPFEEVGIESIRERSVVGAMPATVFLHVWWARRPLSASKGAILASILPSKAIKEFQTFMNFCKGLKKTYERIKLVKKLGTNERIGYLGDRSFKLNLSNENNKKLLAIIKEFWNSETINILDCFSGGGSIPFEASRLKLNVYSSELNPVALMIQYGALYYPIVLGENFFKENRHYFERVIKKSKERLKSFFPSLLGQKNDAYIWARTVSCPNPKCNLKTPLSPNWDLIRTSNRTILKLMCSKANFDDTNVYFNIIENPTSELLKQNSATIKRGIGICPRCNTTIPGKYIKLEAQNGRLGHQLIAIGYKEKISKKKEILRFRIPNDNDLNAIKEAEKELEKLWPNWLKENLIPSENFPKGCDNRPIQYGMEIWYKFFNSRQLLSNCIFLEEVLKLKNELKNNSKIKTEEMRAIITYLQLTLDKICDYNSISTMWSSTTLRIAHTFARHDFSFKWSYVEMEVLEKGFDWALKNVEKAYNGIVKLLGDDCSIPKLNLTSADNLEYLKDNSIHAVIIDPPYYNNVMYAELSDFFYVWMKRSLGDLFPNIFKSDLTDKDNEAVANASRFEGMGFSKQRLAKEDYEVKMKNAFHEISRVLKDDGVLTIMFTHKSTDAWDTLAMSLMEAGFEITASWPVHTESDVSLHIAKKNAVKTTIFLVCRKRQINLEDLWWEDDVLPSIKKIIANKAKEFREMGIDGVDLFVSCFGPALKEFSKGYPVKSITGEIVRAEEAIEAARKVVIDITLQDIIKGRSYNIDGVSKFYLTAWHFFRARSFPFDEARRLALSIGINIDDLKTNYKLLKKKSGDVELILPIDREKNGTISVDNPKDNGILINAVHIALLAYEQGGQKLFDSVVEKLRRNTDKSFRLYMETLFNILPDVKDLAKNLPEKKILGEILMTTEEKITPKGGKITDFFNS